MIGGDRCTRACAFCAVTTARPLALEADEPDARRRGHGAVCGSAMWSSPAWPGTIWPDGGADHFRRTIEAVRAVSPGTVIEVLTPDFNDRDAAIDDVWPLARTCSITISRPSAG